MTYPIQKIQPQHIIRLCGYRLKSPRPTSPDEAFVTAWRTAAEGFLPPGVIYRELCQQIPQWTQKAAAEIDNPIPFDFLDYSVLAPQQNPDDVPSLLEAQNDFDCFCALYRVDFRLVKDTPGSPECIMFNLFELNGSPGMQQSFLMNWVPRGNFKTHEAGFFSSLLHESISPNPLFLAFNRAEWKTADDYAAGIERFEAAFPRSDRKNAGAPATGQGDKPPVRSHLGLFRVAASVTGQDVQTDATMTAVRVREYGAPHVLVPEEVSRPAPGYGQILLRVKAVSINPLDVKMRSGEVREIYPSWFPETLGYSVAGVIEAVGQGVVHRQIGEEVYGINNPIMRGGYAQYVVGLEGFYYPKPKNMDWATAAAAPSVFATAHGALFGRSNLQTGQRVLIHGGSGVIGSCAVQLAKQIGAYVFATASGQRLEEIKALGADEVIDYKTQKFEDIAQDLDLVLDTQGGETRERSWALLKPGGILATLLPPIPDEETARKYGVQAFMVHGHPRIGDIMPDMTHRLETGKLKFPEIAARFPLQEASQAHASYEAHSPRGRIVLEMDGN